MSQSPAASARSRGGTRRRSWGAQAAIACLLAGCVSTPLPDLQVDLPQQWQHRPRAPTATQPAAPDRWWRVFADPRLDTLVDQALAANLDIGQATARLRAARAVYRTSDAPLRPDLHFRTSNPIDPDASASYLMTGFDSTWELGLFGRGDAIHRIARGQLGAAQASLGDARVSVSAEVARQWILLRAARRHEMLLSGVHDLRREQARLTGERLRLRIATPQQAAQARAAAAQAEIALTQPRQAVAAAAQALAVLVGRSEPDPTWLQPVDLPALQNTFIPSAPADLVRQRPDIALAEAAVLNAAGELGIAKADLYPSIAISGSIVRSTSEVERISTDTGSIGSIGPMIDIPLFDWGMRRAKAEAKGEDLQAAALAYRKTVLSAVAEVETALAALEQQRLRERAGMRALHEFQVVAELTAHRRRLGLASDLDVAASDLDRDQAEMEVAAARADRALDVIALCKALGGGPGFSALASTSEKR